MNTGDPVVQSSDPPLIPFEGSFVSNKFVERRLYYRTLKTTSALVLNTTGDSITIGLAQGAGTVSSVNSLVGDIVFSNGVDTSVVVTSGLQIDVLSTDLATVNTLPKRNSLGTFSVGNPTISSHVATKEYVDAIAQNLHVLTPVRAIQASSLGTYGAAAAPGVDVVFTGSGIGKTLTNNGAVAGYTALTIDGIVMTIGKRVLIAGDGLHNGIYTVTTVGDAISVNWVLTRSTDFDTTAEVLSGSYVYVEAGNVYGTSGWTLVTVDPIIVDTTVQNWLQFNSAGQVVAGNIGSVGLGLFANKVGNQLQFYNIAPASSRIQLVDNTSSNNTVDIDVVESELNLNNLSGVLFPLRGGTGLSNPSIGNFLVSNGLAACTNDKVAPAGDVVGTSDVQILTNKTMTGPSNAISAAFLRSASTDIIINSTTPAVGQVLIATSSSTATWQYPFSLSGITSSSQTALGVGSSSLLNSYSVAVGTSAMTNGTYATAIGHLASANNAYTVAIGYNATAAHFGSIILGPTSSDANNQFKVSNGITNIKATGLSTVGTGNVVCWNSSGLLGPNTTGSVILPALTSDPSPVLGGFYYNTATSKLRASTGSVWNELSMTSKNVVSGLVATGSPHTIRSFSTSSNVAIGWRYAIVSPNVGYRRGEIMATWNPNTNALSWVDNSTRDVGSTVAFSMNVSIIAGNVVWAVTVTGGNIWSITYYEDTF